MHDINLLHVSIIYIAQHQEGSHLQGRGSRSELQIGTNKLRTGIFRVDALMQGSGHCFW